MFLHKDGAALGTAPGSNGSFLRVGPPAARAPSGSRPPLPQPAGPPQPAVLPAFCRSPPPSVSPQPAVLPAFCRSPPPSVSPQPAGPAAARRPARVLPPLPQPAAPAASRRPGPRSVGMRYASGTCLQRGRTMVVGFSKTLGQRAEPETSLHATTSGKVQRRDARGACRPGQRVGTRAGLALGASGTCIVRKVAHRACDPPRRPPRSPFAGLANRRVRLPPRRPPSSHPPRSPRRVRARAGAPSSRSAARPDRARDPRSVRVGESADDPESPSAIPRRPAPASRYPDAHERRT